MAGQMQITGLPISGSGLSIAGSSAVFYSFDGPVEVIIIMVGTFTLLMAGKTIWRMTPVRGGGEVRHRA
jgi:hypothetical protein